MVDIPPEIWYRIALFVPDEELCHLLGVNNVFFDLAMNLRWREVAIETRSTIEAMHILKRLSDPYVAGRLHHFRLRLTHVKAKHTRGNSNRDRGKDFKQLKQHFYLIINRVFKIKHRVSNEINIAAVERLDPQSSRPTFSDVVNAIVAATPYFVNVRELTIDSWDLPPSYGNLETLFSSFWTSFGENLQCLSLGGNMEGFRVFIESNPRFKRIQTLRIEFTNNVFRVDREKDTAILVDIVVPFINELKASLHMLQVWSWANLDLSFFFQRLSVPPLLNHLNIRMAFNKVSDPSGLKHLLCEGAKTLERVDLRLNSSGLPFNHTSEESLGRWLSLCTEDPRCFANLRYLDIYPTNTLVGTDVLLTSIIRSSGTLAHLTIRDRYFHLPEATLVLEAASRCRNLTHLRMNVLRLNVPLLDLLSVYVPSITNLWLAVGEAFNNNENAGIGQNFFHELQQRRYMDWKLKDLSISQGGHDVDRETLEAIANSIPSVSSFFGRGHMDIS
ncbi:hypothetical protein JR316_0003581 [Psilocybe cubensis]|uniref:Uncharacterized protein n=2 Tax=Psilocybe cubensis TaxID=181762 RepID=A0ACB8H859_PSICU|nr:hypothetical protein JR316_0003581 [Psilocybe cubensis]KAH9484101.1 hypothetical protein JR316_0003581 [Psilocybe cubensis]